MRSARFAPGLHPPRFSGGFTYIGGLVFLAIVALSASSSLKWGAIEQQRLNEEALLWVGQELQLALASYAATTPANQPSQPNRMADLLRDPRHPGTVRHLRKLYPDPMTGRPEWGEVRTLDGQGILGFYSLSEKKPVKVHGFPQMFVAFDASKSYADWVFSPTPAHALLQYGRRAGRPLQSQGQGQGQRPVGPLTALPSAFVLAAA